MNGLYGLNADIEVLGGSEDEYSLRGMWQDELGLPWIPPTPNLPSLEAAALYTGLCLLEGTNLSMGRGTAMPFQLIGAPWLDAKAVLASLRDVGMPGIMAASVRYVPWAYAYASQECHGILFRITNRTTANPFALTCRLLHFVHLHHRDAFQWQWTDGNNDLNFFDMLAGTARLRPLLNNLAELEVLLSATQSGD